MRTALRLLSAALVLIAVGVQLQLHAAAGFSVANFFSYFTNLSNLFAASVLLACALPGASRAAAWRDVARYMAVVNMSIVGIVFALLLRNEDLGGLLPWVNVVLHYLMPCVVLLDWLLWPPATPLASRHLAVALVVPALYLVYALVRGALVGWYPYPFLDQARAGGTVAVLAYAVGIGLAFLLVGWLLLHVGRRLARRDTDATQRAMSDA